jgi:exosortase/archaeosortase family protein
VVERLHARIGRTQPQSLFGTLVPLAPAAAGPGDGPGVSEGSAVLHRRLRAIRATFAAGRAWLSTAASAPMRHTAALLGVLLLALWPHLAWIARRLTDGSDEPWGALALATVLVLLARDRAALVAPSPRALVASAVLALCAAAALWFLPALLAAAIAMLALAVFITAALPARPAAPMVTLLLLSLPLIASLQFYLGFPLRVATAQAAAPLLALFGISAAPAGASLVFGGTTVLIDAPCAGIGMLWVGSYTAALLSYLNGANARRTLANGLAAALIVFAANVLRNVALFFPEAGLIDAPAVTHDAVGLAAFALALVPIVWFTQWRTEAPADAATPLPAPRAVSPLMARVRAPYVGACLAAAVVPLAVSVLARDAAGATPVRSAAQAAIDWPTTFRGQPLAQLALTPLEARFAQRFPGVIARFAAGREVLVLRHVTQPTRQLHPAVDCFRAAGFAASAPRASTADDGRAWSCFIATRDGERLRVCERIEQVIDRNLTTARSATARSALRRPMPRGPGPTCPPGTGPRCAHRPGRGGRPR